MFLVTGASGQLGQRVLHHLVNTLNVEPQQIIAASRNPEKLEKWASIGVTTRPLDFENKETFTDTLEGVTRALLISTDALDRPGRRLNQHKTAIEAFVKAGIKHVVYTSMPKPSNSPLLIAAYSGAIRTPIPALPGQSFRDKPDTDSAINQPF